MTSTIRPQAGLQRVILFSLVDAPTPSVAALARRVDATRPAVSRAMKALAQRGLVERYGRRWSLTSAGHEELGRLVEPLGPGVRRAIERQARVEREVGTSLAVTSRALVESVWGLQAMQDAVGAMGSFPQILESVGVAPWTHAQAAVHDSLRLHMDVLARPTGWITSLIADNMAATSRIAGDMAAMQDALLGPSRLAQGNAEGLRRAVEAVAEAHHDHLRATLPQLTSDLARPGAIGLVVRPTIASAEFTGAARAIVLPAERREEVYLDARAEELAAMLDAQGAHVPAQAWRGAWAALSRGGPDHSRMVSHEGREFLRLSLVAMAPDERLSLRPGTRPTRRMRIAYIVGDSKTLVTLADVLASKWQALYEAMSAEAHTNREPRLGRQGLMGLLEAAGAVVRVLLDRASQREDA